MSKQKNSFWALKSFGSYLGGYKTRVALVGFVFMVSDILIAVIPLAIGALIGALANHTDPWIFVIILILCSSVHDIMWHVAEISYAKFILPLSFQYETLLFKNVMNRPYHYFVDKFTGKVSSYVTGIAQEIRNFLSDAFFNYISQVVNIVAVVLILGSINWQTGALFIAGFIVMLVVGRFTLTKAMTTEKVETDVISTKNGRIIDAIGNFPSIKSFYTEAREISMMISQQALSFKAANRAFMWGVVFWASMSLFVRHLLWPIAIVMNVNFYLHGDITITQLATLLTTVLLFSNTIWEIIWHISQFGLKFARVEESHTYLFGHAIVREPRTTHENNDSLLFEKKFSINSLTFAYPDKPDELILKDFSLSIKKGEKIGIVGKSGSGKSTLTKLFLGYYPELLQHVTVDGKAVDVTTIGKSIAFVPQDTSLFHRSVSENIAYAANGEPSHEDVIAAAKQAQAHEFIEKLSEGYDALVGERGVKLSGGQRQRIAIARAILKDAPILLLDEATSALDSESEQLIQTALEKLMKNRTSIVIAHRLSTISKLDRIIVLDEGSIIEQGSHEVLLKQKGVYAKLWAHQSGGFIEED